MGLVFIMIAVITIGFPLMCMLLLKWIGLLKSFEAKDKKQRIIPLVLAGMFYLWLFVNIKNNGLIAPCLVQFVLGSTISLFLALLINSFSKISLHAIGMAGLIMGLGIFKYYSEYEYLMINIPFISGLVIHLNIIIAILVFFAGLVGTARLALGAHRINDVWGGYLVGVLGQLIALRFVF